MAQDVKIAKNDDGIYDIVETADGKDFESVEGFETAIGTSIFTDARESEGNVPEAFRRGGWSGNILTLKDNFELGSTLWSLISRMVQDTFDLASDKTRICLQWMLDDGIADTIEVETTPVNDRQARIQIDLFKNTNLVGRYTTLWTNTQAF